MTAWGWTSEPIRYGPGRKDSTRASKSDFQIRGPRSSTIGGTMKSRSMRWRILGYRQHPRRNLL